MKVTPNRARFAWDVVVAVAAAAFSAVFVAVLTGSFAGAWALAVAAPIVLLGNAVAGIYSRFKVASGVVKTALLGAASLAGAAAAFALGAPLAAALLFVVLVWPAMALPRVFLNLHTKADTGSLVHSIVNDKGPVLVVGGAGYIGTHVVEQLLAAGKPVRVLDRLMYGKAPIQDFLKHPRFEFVEGDATDIQKLTAAVNGASGIVHLAGLVGDPACAVDVEFTRHTNIIATRMVKEIALSFGVPRFVFASSCSVYGVNPDKVSEASTPNPVSLYAETKIDSERELLLCKNEDFAATILRFATVFGHSRRSRFDLVANLFTAQAFVEGKIRVIGPGQWRPFVHVRDLARAIVTVLMADREKVRGEIFNVGDETLNTTIGDLGDIVAKVVGEERTVTVDVDNNSTDLRNYAVSFKKIQEELGFRCATSLEQGVREILSEFKQGTYGAYRDAQYSNLATTKEVVRDFHDPLQIMNLYRPLAVSDPKLKTGTAGA